MQKLTTQLSLSTTGVLEFMILKMLASKTYSPQEIFLALKSIGYKTPMGSIYPLLSKLRKEEFVSTGHEESESGRAMKTYQLTAKGKSRLSELRSDWKRLNSAIASL